MIKKLRTKFVVWTMVSIFTLLFVILGSVNLVNFVKLSVEADSITSMILSEGGAITPSSEEGSTRPQNGMGPNSPETPYEIRFFIVDIAENGDAKVSAKRAAISDEVAINYATSIFSKKYSRKTGWYMEFYRYRIHDNDDNTHRVIFLNRAREINPTVTVFVGSLIGGAIGLLTAFAVVIPISKRFVKPYAEAQERQKTFISNSSHELKTPLTIISANNELIEIQYGENEFSDAISKQVQRLTSSIKTMNTLTKFEEASEIAFSRLSLSTLCQNAIEPYIAAFQASKIKFSYSIDAGIEIKANETSLMTLLSVMLDNALKYAYTYVDFKLVKEGMSAFLVIRNNTQQKLRKEETQYVFDRFSRGSSARASSIEGSGIGLSIAKTVAEKHDAVISADVEDGDFVIKVVFKNSIPV